jgi:hypothetical protein
MITNRNTGPYTVAELDELMKPFRYLAYNEARTQNEADCLSCRIVGVGNRDAKAIAQQMEKQLQLLFPKLAVSVRGVTGNDRLIVNVGNGEEWANLTRGQIALAEDFEKTLLAMCEKENLKVVSSHDPKVHFIPTGYQQPD